MPHNFTATLSRAQQNQLDQKQESYVSNLDKSPLQFSKRQSIIVNERLQDFYTVKVKRHITDDKAIVQVRIVTSSPDIKCTPDSFPLDIRQ